MSRIPIKVGTESQDLGVTIEGLNMAAGATVYGQFVDNLEWVRNLMVLAQSDQQYDLLLSRRDKSGAVSTNNTALSTGQSATGANITDWRQHPTIGQNGLIGYSAKFGIKNSAAVANTFARLRVQLLGL